MSQISYDENNFNSSKSTLITDIEGGIIDLNSSTNKNIDTINEPIIDTIVILK